MALNWLDTAIIILSLVFVMVVGWFAGRRDIKTARAYFLASDSLPWYAIGASWVATSVSSEQIVGTVGMAYKVGMGVANWEWFGFPTMVLLLVFFIPIYLKVRIATIPDFLTRRFGSFCGDFYSFVMLVAYVFIFLPTILYSGTIAFADITGLSFRVVLGTTVLLIGIYTVKGGLAAVVWTDLAQCTMLLGGGLLLFFVALNHIPGGWTAMIHSDPQRYHLIQPASDPYAPFLGIVFASVGVNLFYNASNQVMIQRVLGARTEWDGLMGVVFSGFINLLRPLVTCFLGLIVFRYCVLRGSMLSDPNLTFSFAVRTFAGTGLRGIIMAGFLAAVMGAAGATTNSASTIFTLDMYGRFIRPESTDKSKVYVGRVATATVLLIAAAWCPLVGYAQTIFTYFQTGVTYLATPFIAVSLVGIFWRRPNSRAGSIGLVGGLVIQILAVLAAHLLLTLGYVSHPVHWLYIAFVAEVLTVLLVVGVSFRMSPPPAEKIEGLIWSSALLQVFVRQEGRWYTNLIFWFAIYSAIWFAVYIHFR
jgi:solute:Na+ symporter, SSS family